MAERRRPPVPVIVLVVLALAGGGTWWWSTQQAAAQPDRIAGSVEATQYAVASVISGKVAEVKVAEGDTVRAGDTVVTLDPTALHLGVDQAKAGVAAAQALVTQRLDDGTDAEVAEARARQAQAEAAVKLAEVQLGHATLTAPLGGTVVTVTTNVGQAATPGRTLVTILDPSDVWVRAYVPEPRLAAVSVGAVVHVSGDGLTPRDGTVTWVSAEPEFTPNNVETRDQRTKLVYQIRVHLPADAALKPGQPVDVTLP